MDYRKADHCESGECLWMGAYDIQGVLEVDHKDGDWNNSLDNLWTLCRICHGMKYRAKDHLKKARVHWGGWQSGRIVPKVDTDCQGITTGSKSTCSRSEAAAQAKFRLTSG